MFHSIDPADPKWKIQHGGLPLASNSSITYGLDLCLCL